MSLSIKKIRLSLAVLFCAVAIATASPQQAPVRRASSRIQGMVVEASGGAPISDVLVTAGGPGRSPTAVTDKNGHYVIKDLPPGVYSVFPRKDGYGKLTSASPHRVRVLAGSVVSEVNFRLHKGGVISGRVFDYSMKTPIPGMRIGVWAKGFVYGMPFAAFQGSARTDAQGSYRVADLEEGTYYVSASPQTLHPTTEAAPGVAPTGPAQTSYVRTFYPDEPSLEYALPISLGPEEEASGVDLILKRSKTFCVTSAVPSGIDLESQVVAGVSEPGILKGSLLGMGIVSPGQRFSFCGLPPESYVLTVAVANKQHVWTSFGLEPFLLESHDVSLGPISLVSGQQVSGKVLAEGQMAAGSLEKLGIELDPLRHLPFGKEDNFEKVSESGMVLFNNLCPDDYRLRVWGLPPGYYVKEASVGSHDAIREPVRPGSGELQILLGTDGPALAGQVVDKNGAPVSDAIVVLVSQRGANDPSTLQITSTQTDQTGTYQFAGGISPGEYDLLALTDLPEKDSENPTSISRLLRYATTITLAASSRQQIRLESVAANR